VASGIGTLNESPLHAALRRWYAQPGDVAEAQVDGYIVDLLRGDLVIEVQTGAFYSLRPKLAALVGGHCVRLVVPVARERWIVRLGADGAPIGRRRSPAHAGFAHVCAALVSFPGLLAEEGFSLHALLTEEEELRTHTGRGWRKRGWRTHERRLLRVLDERLFETPADLAALLPTGLPEPFTAADLASALDVPRRTAGQLAYCLRALHLLGAVGKRGHAPLYARLSRQSA